MGLSQHIFKYLLWSGRTRCLSAYLRPTPPSCVFTSSRVLCFISMCSTHRVGELNNSNKPSCSSAAADNSSSTEKLSAALFYTLLSFTSNHSAEYFSTSTPLPQRFSSCSCIFPAIPLRRLEWKFETCSCFPKHPPLREMWITRSVDFQWQSIHHRQTDTATRDYQEGERRTWMDECRQQ